MRIVVDTNVLVSGVQRMQEIGKYASKAHWNGRYDEVEADYKALRERDSVWIRNLP